MQCCLVHASKPAASAALRKFKENYEVELAWIQASGRTPSFCFCKRFEVPDRQSVWLQKNFRPVSEPLALRPRQRNYLHPQAWGNSDFRSWPNLSIALIAKNQGCRRAAHGLQCQKNLY